MRQNARNRRDPLNIREKQRRAGVSYERAEAEEHVLYKGLTHNASPENTVMNHESES